VRVAAYQAPLAATRPPDVLRLIAAQVARCEAAGVEILCCPEGVLGGLADYVAPPSRLVFAADGHYLADALAPPASATVTTIVGYTEHDDAGRLFNAAAVFHGGAVVGGTGSCIRPSADWSTPQVRGRPCSRSGRSRCSAPLARLDGGHGCSPEPGDWSRAWCLPC
jgi:hypothetical protein